MERLAIYAQLKAAVKCETEVKAWRVLSRANIDDIHGYFCKELPAEHAAACASCDELLRPALQKRNVRMIAMLLLYGAYPPVEVCASTEFDYGRIEKAPTPLKLAVEFGSLDDVRKLLRAGADVNAHPRMCVKIETHSIDECTNCDSPLMAAVRRRDVVMIRLLITHGASLSEVIHTDTVCRPSKSDLVVAAETGDEEVITELVSCGADVNQWIGPVGTVLHHVCNNVRLVNLLVRLGADPNVGAERGSSVLSMVLLGGNIGMTGNLDLVLQSLRLLLPTTRHLDHYLHRCYAIVWLQAKCSMLLLQHGARIEYSRSFLLKSPQYLSWAWGNQNQHSEAFIQLLRAADTDFSGVRQRIASLDRKTWEVLNLDVLEEKLSQPLTLQTSCVISVRRRLRSISDVGMWARIDALPLSVTIRDLLKLIVW